MKLKKLAIDGFGAHRNLQLGTFNDGFSIVYGENGSGKSTIREFVRGTLFDFGQTGRSPNNKSYSAGRINVVCGVDEFQLSRDVQLNSAVDVRALTNGAANQRVDSFRQLAGNLNTELYDTVFSVSFRETPMLANRLAFVLQNQLGVPAGSEAAGDNSAHHQWQREQQLRRERLESLRAQIDSLTFEKDGYLAQIDSAKLGQQSQLADIERQINQIIARINEIQSSSSHEQLANIEREISPLRLSIENAQTITNIAHDVHQPDQHTALYQRLDEIDNQIRRWRHVQSDIQNQRVRLRDEMLVWNELTLDSDEHPYHTARAILVSLESKVDEAERNANHWGDAGASRVDTSQMARTLGQLCQTMRDDLYGLCNELAQQYKHIRHKAAAAELKQLRRCYNEMGENIQRLLQRRDTAIREIRDVDPSGAAAIARSETKFCECAQHAGYLEARRRFVGPVPLTSTVDPTYRVSAPDLQSDTLRLASLEQQWSELSGAMVRIENELIELNARHAELVRQRDNLLGDFNFHELNLKIQNLDQQLQVVSGEYSTLQQRAQHQHESVPPRANPVIERACELLTRASSGDLTQVFLGTPLSIGNGTTQFEIQVRDQHGKVLNFSALEPGLQDQAYLCLMLAAKEHLQLNNIEAPTLIDDAFYRIGPDRVAPTLTVLNEFASRGHQIIALTQHRYLADRVPGLTVLELPPTMPTSYPALNPDRTTATEPPVVPPMIEPRDAHLYPEIPATSDAYSTSAQIRPYPLSKYPRSNPNSFSEDRSYTVTYPFPSTGVQQGPDVLNPELYKTSSPTPSVTSIRVNSVGDRLGYVSSIDESTRLDKVGFFDPNQLRTFQAAGIDLVGDLLEFDLNQDNRFGFHVEQLERWQAQLWLLINLPGMRINDARVLVACGVTEPEQLDTSHPQQIHERIQRFFETSEGRRFSANHDTITLDRINGWYRSLDATRPRWEDRRRTGLQKRGFSNRGSHSDSSSRTSRPAQTQTARAYQPPVRRPAREPRMNTPRGERKIVPRVTPAASLVASNKPTNSKPAKIGAPKGKLKFYLDLNDHIEAAPSIGPKAAERFEKIGVYTVTDFLKQTADSMAEKINYKRITADLVRQWQHQARLVCRIPNLRGHDAQLLVACGVTEPEEISTMQPQRLFEIIGPFSETKEGLKIIRNGKKPDLAEITNWISWSEATRSLQAA